MQFPIELPNGVQITAARDPQWGNRDKTLINLTVSVKDPVVHPDGADIEFTACPWDEMAHGVALFEAFKDNAAPYERRDVTVEDLQADLDKLMPDILLGLATDEEIDLARTLRKTIKEMTA